MPENQAKAFLEYLRDRSDERGGLQNAVVEEIVAAGAEAGFIFTAGDLHAAFVERPPHIHSWNATKIDVTEQGDHDGKGSS